MFLIEYAKGNFVDASKIDTVVASKPRSAFTLSGDSNNEYFIHSEFVDTFFNNLQAINGNLNSIEQRYKELTQE